jgi:hypothetical protein
MTLYAKKRERVLCENGHVIATLMRDFERGEVVDNSAFAFAPGMDPQAKYGEVYGNCPTCGGGWNSSREGGNTAMMHFEDGWRS